MEYNEYIKKFKEFNEEEKDTIGEDPTACWCYAYVVAKELGLNIDCFENTVNKSEFKLEKYKIYVCFFETDVEMHYFVIKTNNKDAIVYSTYGGNIHFIKNTFTIYELQLRIQDLSKENFEYIFDIELKYENEFNCELSYSTVDII